jgi:hypothetical protein
LLVCCLHAFHLCTRQQQRKQQHDSQVKLACSVWHVITMVVLTSAGSTMTSYCCASCAKCCFYRCLLLPIFIGITGAVMRLLPRSWYLFVCSAGTHPITCIFCSNQQWCYSSRPTPYLPTLPAAAWHPGSLQSALLCTAHLQGLAQGTAAAGLTRTAQ